MKKSILLCSVLFVSASCMAQFNSALRNNDNNQSQGSKKFYFSMGGGLGFGTDANGYKYFYYSLLPVVGYKLTEQFSVGSIITYQRYNYSNLNASYTQYGLGPFARYTLNPIFFQAEYDLISAPSFAFNGDAIRSTHSRLLFGVGYNFSTGQRASIGGLVMYDVLYRVPSVFASPVVTRVFVSF